MKRKKNIKKNKNLKMSKTKKVEKGKESERILQHPRSVTYRKPEGRELRAHVFFGSGPNRT
jgi:hypothetical protein